MYMYLQSCATEDGQKASEVTMEQLLAELRQRRNHSEKWGAYAEQLFTLSRCY